jgi:2,5-diketo-D-gluconate reductase B
MKPDVSCDEVYRRALLFDDDGRGLVAEAHQRLERAGIPLTAYAPLAQGRAAGDPTLASLGQKYGCSAAQMAVAWLLDEKGVIVIPKAARSESQKANLDALGTQLDD